MSALRSIALSGLFLCGHASVRSVPAVINTNLQMRLLMNTTNDSRAHSIRIAKDPRNNQLYYLKFNGEVYRLEVMPGDGTSSSVKAYSAADHGIADSAQGMAIGPDGTIYVVGNTTTNNGNSTFARIMKGVPDGSAGRIWSLLAKTEPYPRSRTAFDHVFNGIMVSPDGNDLYVNSGSRTDHGEVQSVGGVFPDTREVALTAKIFRLPANGSELLLQNDIDSLRSAGYLFAEGVRNSFAFGFAPNGDLFATENGPDRDMAEELNWLRPGLHYGFPWRMGGTDNPQQFPDYDPSTDRLLDPRFTAVQNGYYRNDPTFPQAPPNLAEPVINIGPDADSYRDPADGSIKDASALGQTLATFTAHRSPLGLVFDTAGAMAAPYQFHGFMLSWTPGDANGTSEMGPFKDASADMVDLALTKLGNTNYQARVTRVVGGFANPIDAEIISNKVYVIEYGGSQGIWEITFPAMATPTRLDAPAREADGSFRFFVSGEAGRDYTISASTNLLDWLPLTNLLAPDNVFPFSDPTATGFPRQFYRAVQPQ